MHGHTMRHDPYMSIVKATSCVRETVLMLLSLVPNGPLVTPACNTQVELLWHFSDGSDSRKKKGAASAKILLIGIAFQVGFVRSISGHEKKTCFFSLLIWLQIENPQPASSELRTLVPW